MLIERLWKYEYSINLINKACSAKIFSENNLIYGNIMLFWPLLTS